MKVLPRKKIERPASVEKEICCKVEGKRCVPETASTNWPLMKSLVNLMSSSGTSNPFSPLAAAIVTSSLSLGWVR